MVIDHIQNMTGEKVSLRSFDRRYKFLIPGQLKKIDRAQNRITIELKPSIWSSMSLVSGGNYFVQVGANQKLWFCARAIGIYQIPKPHLILEINTPSTTEKQPLPEKGIEVQDAATDAAMRLSEINLNGAILTTTHQVGQINDRLQIELSSPKNEESIKLDCSIRYLHQNKSEYKYGVDFDRLDNETIEIIKHFPGTPPDCA
jgi:predicted RNA-binding protein